MTNPLTSTSAEATVVTEENATETSTQTQEVESTESAPTSSSFMDFVPEAYRETSMLKGIDSPEALFAKMDQLHTSQGGTIKLPTSKATDEERAAFAEQVEKATHKNFLYAPNKEDPEKSVAFWQKLGAPENAEGYKDPEIQVENDNYLLPDNTNTTLREAAAAANMTQDQWEKFASTTQESHMKQVEQQIISIQSDHASLRAKYGDAYDAALKESANLYKDYFGEEINPAELSGNIVEGLYALAQAIGEEPEAGALTPQRQSGLDRSATPAMLEKEMSDLMDDLFDMKSEGNVASDAYRAKNERVNAIAGMLARLK